MVPAAARSLGAAGFATESAFAAHLLELRERLPARFGRLVLLAPEWPAAEHERLAASLAVLPPSSGIHFLPAYRTDISRPQFLRHHLLPLWRRVKGAVQDAAVVHSGLSHQLAKPLLFMACVAGWRLGRTVLFIVDIDHRRSSRRLLDIGAWNLRQYAVNRWVYDPLKWLQMWLAPRMFDLVLLKSAGLVRAFGRGRPQVKNFYDTVHAERDVLAGAALASHLARLQWADRPLQAVVFSRLVPNKGVERALQAVALARAAGASVQLTVIGEGESRSALEAFCAAQGLQDAVRFTGPRAYGEALFAALAGMDLMLATPLIEDTPRAAFDAMARGLPILAFDIAYFRDLAEGSGAVALARWPEPSDLARELVALQADRPRLARMAASGIAFARENTQAVWLQRRLQWTMEAVLRREGARRSGSSGA